MKEINREYSDAFTGILKEFIMVAFVAFILGLSPATNSSAADDPEAIIAEAARLNDTEKFEESNQLLMKLAQTDPDHPDVYWKIAQNFYDLGERIPIEQKDKKLDMYIKCEEWAKKGYDKNPDLADNACC